MAGPVIAITENIFPTLAPAEQALAKLNPTFRMAKSTSAADVLDVARDADAILVTYAKLPRELIMQLTRCKAIGRFGLGVDNIDLPAAKEKGIAVNYVPDYCIREVSDHAMAMLLALIRKIPFSEQTGAGRPLGNAGGGADPPHRGHGAGPHRLRQYSAAGGAESKSLRHEGDRLRPFRQARAVQGGRRRRRRFRYAACNRSDYISVHAPLTPQTRGMVNAQAFGKMKKGVYIVNTARGPLIDEAALIAALDAGQVGGAALDVVAVEPLAKQSPLLGRDNVIVTPHTAFYSIEALDELQSKCASDVARVLSGEKALYPISA